MGSSDESLAKIDWAEKHLRLLQDDVNVFCNGKAHSFRAERQSDTDSYFFFGRSNPCPAEWGLIIGDVAHATRCALDYIVDRMSLLVPDDKLRKKLGLP